MDAGVFSAVIVIFLFVAMAIWKIERKVETLEHQVNAQKYEIELLTAQTAKQKE